MFDLVKRIVRHVAGNEEEHQSRQKDLASKLDRDDHNSRQYQYEQGQRHANGPHDSVPREQQSQQSKHVHRLHKCRGHDQGHEVPDQDRQRMPPPSSRRKPSSVHRFKRSPTLAGSQLNSEADTRSMVTGGSLASKLGGLFEAEQEKRALQHVEAFRIHPDSGFWYQSEAGLYEHLWIRGKEPLLPFAWAPDFKTYPTTLFNLDPDDIPLITNIYASQFHAIRALRELVELGHHVRDQLQGGLKLFKIQRTIKMGIEAYVMWALNDADLYAHAATIPVHHIARRRPKETTVDAITALADKMYGLLARHQRAFETTSPTAIRSPTPQGPTHESPGRSAIPSSSPVKDAEEPQILDDSQGRLPPVIIGFLVVGPTATVFTLNARNADAAVAGDPTRGIHMLGRFNFTESRFDVWNALALALAVCHLRTALLAVAKPTATEGESRLLHGTLAGYLGRDEFEATKKRKREDAEQDGPEMPTEDLKGKSKAKVATNCTKRRKALALDDSDPDR